MILRELVGPGREAFNIGMVVWPLCIVSALFAIEVVRRTNPSV
jgi:hypothetical protein